MKIFGYFLCIMALYICSCSSPRKSKEEVQEVKHTLPAIPFSEGMDNEKEFSLSEIATDVKCVALKKFPGAFPIKVIRDNIVLTDNNIFIHCSTGLYKFDMDGNFICKLGKRGKGKGEYGYLANFTVNEKDGRVLALCNLRKQMYVYDLNGKFIDTHTFPNVMQYIRLDDSSYVAYNYNGSGQEKELLIFTDLGGIKKGALPQTDHFDGKEGVMIRTFHDRYFYHYRDSVCFKDYCNDTVFYVRTDSLLPRYTLAMGRYGLPEEKRYERIISAAQFKSYAGNYLRPNIVETDRYIYIPSWSWALKDGENPALVIYDKEAKKCFRAKDDKIKNDLDYTLPLIPCTVSNGKLVGFYTAEELVALSRENPGLREINLVRRLTSEDFPIVVIATLK